MNTAFPVKHMGLEVTRLNLLNTGFFSKLYFRISSRTNIRFESFGSLQQKKTYFTVASSKKPNI